MDKRLPISLNFSNPVMTIFDTIKFPNRHFSLAGTAGIKEFSIWASDIDLFQKLEESDMKKFLPHILSLIRDIESMPDTYFVELKSNGKHYYKKDLMNLKTLEKIEKGLKRDPFNKIDVLYFDGAYFTEITLVYSFAKRITLPALVSAIKEDLRDQIAEGNIYKAFKRAYNIGRLTGKRNKIVDDIVMDSVLGTINVAKGRLDATERAHRELSIPTSEKRMRHTLEMVKQDLSKVLPHKMQTHIIKLFKQGDIGIAMDDVKEYLNKITLKKVGKDIKILEKYI